MKIIKEPGTLHKEDDPIGNSEPMEKLEIKPIKPGNSAGFGTTPPKVTLEVTGRVWPESLTNPTSKLIVKSPNDTIFFKMEDNKNEEVIRLCFNGDILVHGKLITNELQVVDALKEWMISHGVDYIK